MLRVLVFWIFILGANHRVPIKYNFINFILEAIKMIGLYGKKIFDWNKKDRNGKSLRDMPIEEQKAEILKAASNFVRKINTDPVAKIPLSREKVSGIDSNLMGAVPIVLVMSDTIKTPDRG